MTAYEFLAHIEAGLTLAGGAQGTLLWTGTDAQWRLYESLLWVWAVNR